MRTGSLMTANQEFSKETIFQSQNGSDGQSSKSSRTKPHRFSFPFSFQTQLAVLAFPSTCSTFIGIPMCLCITQSPTLNADIVMSRGSPQP